MLNFKVVSDVDMISITDGSLLTLITQQISFSLLWFSYRPIQYNNYQPIDKCHYTYKVIYLHIIQVRNKHPNKFPMEY